MEKGSFQTSRFNALHFESLEEQDDFVASKISLPNELPKNLDFNESSEVKNPTRSPTSATLETLIGQNEDLMARLSVQIRRSSLLEEKSTRLEDEQKQLQMRLETLKEQYLILKEKDRLTEQRAETANLDRERFKSQAEKLERMYSDLFVQAQALKRKYTALERYRARLKKVLPAVHKKAKLFQPEMFAQRLDQLNKSHETKIREIRTEMEKLKSDAADRELLFHEKIKIENSLVFERRQHELTRSESQSRIATLEQENIDLKHHVKDLLIKKESALQEMESIKIELPHLQDERRRLLDQVDTLQLLWEQKQTDLEKLEQKVQGLQKLNQSISLNLNERGKDISRLEAKIEQERLAAKEREQALKAEIALLRR